MRAYSAVRILISGEIDITKPCLRQKGEESERLYMERDSVFAWMKEPPLDAADLYPVLKQSVLDLYLCPGSVFSIREICEYYQVGRSPVRDALMRLEQEGLVTMLPQKGVMISLLDRKIEAEERFMRLALEEAVMTQFIDICSEERHIEELKKLLQKQKDYLETGEEDTRRFLQLDDAFHKYFYDATDKMLCLEAQRMLGGHYRRMRLLRCEPSQIAENIQQHEEILNFVTERNIEKVKEVFRIHVQKLEMEEEQILQKYPYMFANNAVGFRPAQSMDIDYLEMVYHHAGAKRRCV